MASDHPSWAARPTEERQVLLVWEEGSGLWWGDLRGWTTLSGDRSSLLFFSPHFGFYYSSVIGGQSSGCVCCGFFGRKQESEQAPRGEQGAVRGKTRGHHGLIVRLCPAVLVLNSDRKTASYGRSQLVSWENWHRGKTLSIFATTLWHVRKLRLRARRTHLICHHHCHFVSGQIWEFTFGFLAAGPLSQAS